MEWKRKNTVYLAIVMTIIIAASLFIYIIRLPTNSSVVPIQILEGEAYDIVSDITTSGMFIRWDAVNDILKEKNLNAEKLYKYIINRYNLPEEFDKEIRRIINPSYLEFENAYKMYVNFDIAIDDKTFKVRVNTRGYDKTLAYYLAVEQSRRVMFLQGMSATVSAVALSDTFPSSSSSGNYIFGTPYNFVPIFPGEADAISNK
jgi:hypothetical protein